MAEDELVRTYGMRSGKHDYEFRKKKIQTPRKKRTGTTKGKMNCDV
jgi:hypothetical protein